MTMTIARRLTKNVVLAAISLSLPLAAHSRNLAAHGRNSATTATKQPGSKSATKPQLVLQAGHSESIHALALSPDGTRLASFAAQELEGDLRLWNARTGELLRVLAMPSGLRGGKYFPCDLAFVPGTRRLALWNVESSFKKRRAWEWDIDSGRLLLDAPGRAYSGDGARTMQRENEDRIVFRDARNGRMLGVLRTKLVDARDDFFFSPDGLRVATARPMPWDSEAPDGDLRARVWSVRDGRLLFTLHDARTKQDRVIGPVAWSPDGKTLASGGENPAGSGLGRAAKAVSVDDQVLKIWDARTGKRLRALGKPFPNYSSVQLLTFLPGSNTRLIVHSRIISARTGKILRDLQLKEQRVMSWSDGPEYVSPEAPLVLSRNGKTLVSAFSDIYGGGVTFWSLRNGHILRRLAATPLASASLAVSPDGARLALGSDSTFNFGTTVWDSRAGRLVKSWPDLYSSTVRFEPRNVLATADLESATWWDIATGKLRREWKPPRVTLLRGKPISYGYSDGIVWTPDGALMITRGGEDEPPDTLRLWNAATGRLVRTIGGFPLAGWLEQTVAFSPDSRYLASAAYPGMQWWNLQSGVLERTFLDPTDASHSADRPTIAANGQVIAASTAFSDAAILWNPHDGTPLGAVSARDPDHLALSPDGELLAVAKGKDIRLFATRGATTKTPPLRTLSGAYKILRLAFSPSGHRLLVCDSEGTSIWSVARGRLLAKLLLLSAKSKAPARWLIITPEGYFKGSRGIEKAVRFRDGNRLQPSAYSKRFLQPARVEAALQSEN